MKMIEGCNFQANVKTAETSFWASPNHLLCNVDERTLMKHAPDSLANAFANRVFPSRVVQTAEHPLQAATTFLGQKVLVAQAEV